MPASENALLMAAFSDGSSSDVPMQEQKLPAVLAIDEVALWTAPSRELRQLWLLPQACSDAVALWSELNAEVIADSCDEQSGPPPRLLNSCGP